MKKTLVKNTLVALLSLVVLYAIFFFWLDKPIEIWMYHHAMGTRYDQISIWLGKIFKSVHWSIIAILAIFIGLSCHTSGRKKIGKNWLFLAFSIIIAQAICFILKVLLARYRPIELFTHQLYGFHFLSTQYNLTSTPSGHATSSFAALLAIGYIFKQTWLTILLLAFATIIAISRVIMAAHFPSDVILGAYIGVLTVVWLHALFNRSTGA